MNLKTLIELAILFAIAAPEASRAQETESETTVAAIALQAIAKAQPKSKPVVILRRNPIRDQMLAKRVGWQAAGPRQTLKCPSESDLSECKVPVGQIALEIVGIELQGMTARVEIVKLSPPEPRAPGDLRGRHTHLVYEVLVVCLSRDGGKWSVAKIEPGPIS
jgi:hypothetical protein